MNGHRFPVKTGAFLFTFLLVAAGRWVVFGRIGTVTPSAAWFAAGYGLVVGAIAVFTVDLVLARGLLQRKILFIRILAADLVVVGLLDRFLEPSGPALAAGLIVSAALLLILIAADALLSGGLSYRVVAAAPPPRRYLRRRPIKTAVEILLRLFPFPEAVGLYRIGSAGFDSPVLVTGNFELTVRRVCAALKHNDCWLLVCDSRGVNVWCGSMAGHFTTDSLVRAMERTGLAEQVRRRELILPQLCASSISLEQLKARTGFSGRFGPLDIRDISTYWQNPADPDIRRARFPLPARLEMALGSPLLLTVVVVLVYNFIGLRHLPVVLPLLYLAALLQGLIFPRRPLIRIGTWSVLYGSAVFLLTGLLARALFPAQTLLYALTVGLGSAYLVTEFSGWSPLLKYSLIPYGKPRVRVDAAACIGCRRCAEVCPRGVFMMEGGRSRVVGEQRCVICRSCFSQCPSGAVRHSHAEP